MALSAALLRLHRSGRSSLLVLGGTPAQRQAVGRVFHENSMVRERPMMVVDCARRESDLSRALTSWLSLAGAMPAAPNPLRECDQGTLFLEFVGRLSPVTQRLLLVLALRIARNEPADAADPGPYRLAAGDDSALLDAVERHEFDEALFDALDKVRGDVSRPARRGAA